MSEGGSVLQKKPHADKDARLPSQHVHVGRTLH